MEFFYLWTQVFIQKFPQLRAHLVRPSQCISFVIKIDIVLVRSHIVSAKGIERQLPQVKNFLQGILHKIKHQYRNTAGVDLEPTETVVKVFLKNFVVKGVSSNCTVLGFKQVVHNLYVQPGIKVFLYF